MKLTRFGSFVRLHTSATPILFWTGLLAEADGLADEDGDIDLFFEEKIHGLTEMQARIHEFIGEMEDDDV